LVGSSFWLEPRGVFGDGSNFTKIQTDAAGTFTGNVETFSAIVERRSSDAFRFDVKNSATGDKVAVEFDWTSDSPVSKLVGSPDVFYSYLPVTPTGKELLRIVIRYDGGASLNVSGDNRAIIFAPDERDQSSSTAIHHVQLEEAPTSTSPILNSRGSTRTREGESVTIFDGGKPSWYNPDEGTFIVTFQAQMHAPTSGVDYALAPSDGGTRFLGLGTQRNISCADSSGNLLQFNKWKPYQTQKWAISYNKGDIRAALDGVAKNTGGHDGSFANLTDLKMAPFGGAQFLWINGQYIPQSLPKSTLETLTA
jgi:hypothetical protein